MSAIDVRVPDLGDFKDVPIIEVLVKPGDRVGIDDSLVTLESDKATMDVPSPSAGTVSRIAVKVGDKVSEGNVVLTLESEGGSASASPPRADGTGKGAEQVAPRAATASTPPPPEIVTPAPRGEKGRADSPGEGASTAPAAGATIEVRVPDIGDFRDVPVIEVFVKPGDNVKPDDPIATLESDKATMDVPAPLGGVVEAVRVAVGDRVSEGTPLITLKTSQTGAEPASRDAPPSAPSNFDRAVPPIAAEAAAKPPRDERMPADAAPPVHRTDAQPRSDAARDAPTAGRVAHASPSVRKFARELGVDIGNVAGSGPKGRILHDDVQQFVKSALSAPASAMTAPADGGALALLPWPQVDFAKFGAIERKARSRIRKISGANLARNWVMIPHVTQFDDADITELEAFRVAINKENENSGVKLTILAFLIKASVAALRAFPDFNASLGADGESLFYKKYFNIGFAADTPGGLVVPVIKGADSKGVLEIAKEMAELSARAREGKLAPTEMQGGCFSISSLGGIGGTMFTPIINAPEVAILGASRNATKPAWDGKRFKPRLMLPLSLSYDHRVIDGAEAARFIVYFANVLADFRRVLL